MATKTLTISIIGEDKSGKATLDKSAADVGKYSATVESKMQGLGSTIGKAFAGIAVAKFGKEAIAEAEESQKAAALTNAVLKSTGGQANITSKEIGDLAQKLSEKTAVDDEQIQSGENMLLTFTNVRNEVGKGNDIFNQATEIAGDLSAATGVDLVKANVTLGKALNDPVKGITALQRVGVTFTAQQKDQIATLVKSGDVMGAQKIILGELTKEFGGAAASQATDLGKAGVAWKNFEEDVGNALGPAVSAITGFGTAAFDAFDEVPEPVQTTVVALSTVAGGLVFLAPKLESAYHGAQKLWSVLDPTKLVGTKSAVEGIGKGSEALADNAGHAKLATVGMTTAALGLVAIGLEQWYSAGAEGASKYVKAIGAGANGPAEELRQVKEEQKRIIADWMKTGELDQTLVGTNSHWGALLDRQHELEGQIAATKKQQDNQIDALKEGKRGSEAYQAGIDNARIALEKFGKELNQTYDDLNRGRDAQATFEEANDSLGETLKANGWSWELNTEQGRKNNEAMEKAQHAILGVADAKFQETGRTKDAVAATDQYIWSLIETLKQAGYSDAKIHELLQTYGLIPGDIETHVQLNGVPDAVAGADAVRNHINLIPKNTAVVVDIFGNTIISPPKRSLADVLGIPQKAKGGPVRKGEQYIVTEKGDEGYRPRGSAFGTVLKGKGPQLWTAPADGTIETNSALRAMRSLGAGAPSESWDEVNPNVPGGVEHITDPNGRWRPDGNGHMVDSLGQYATVTLAGSSSGAMGPLPSYQMQAAGHVAQGGGDGVHFHFHGVQPLATKAEIGKHVESVMREAEKVSGRKILLNGNGS